MDWSSISSTVGAAFAVLLFLQSPQANAFLPPEFHSSVRRLLRRFYKLFSNYIYFTVDEYDGVTQNELYTAAQLHLSDTAVSAARSARLTLPKNASAATCTIADNERIRDTFEGTKIWWAFSTVERRQPGFGGHDLPDERRALHMCIHKSDRDKVMKSYIPHLRHRLQLLRLQRRERFLYTNQNSNDEYAPWRVKVWTSVPFKHPSNFTTLALDPQLKDSIEEDLMQFASAKEFYDRVGRAWKRGYLLYGPPGTGKSSMIAAMANFLEYDVYDLELTHVKSNSELRNLLVKTTNRSIIVIEDIDCSLDLTNERQKKKKKKNVDNKDGDMSRHGGGVEDENEKSMVTLSGLLNFVDGLWSCCGDERIFVFTTNHVEKIDKALLRPGRMDMHIKLSYCCYEAFKILARNYLGLKEEHDLFEDVCVALDEEGAAITPAEVSEVLTKERKNVEKALTCLVKEIKESKFKRQAEREEEEKKRKEREKEEGEEEKEEMEKKRRKEREKEKEEEEKEEEEEKKAKEINKGAKKNNKNEHECDIASSDDDEINDKNDKKDVEDGLDEKLGKKKKNNHEFEEEEEDGKNSKMTKRKKSKDDLEEEKEEEDNEKENKNKKMSSEEEYENDNKKPKEKNKDKFKEDEDENKEKEKEEKTENNTNHQNGESLES